MAAGAGGNSAPVVQEMENTCCLFCTYGHSYMCLTANTGNVGVEEIVRRPTTELDFWWMSYWLWKMTRSLLLEQALDEVERFFDVVDFDVNTSYFVDRDGVFTKSRLEIESCNYDEDACCWDGSCTDCRMAAAEEEYFLEEEDRYADAALYEAGFQSDPVYEGYLAQRRVELGLPPRRPGG